MKTFIAFLVFILIVAVGSVYQDQLVQRGDLVILQGKGGPIFVDKRDRTITIKTSVFPVKLREGEDGLVYSERSIIAYRAYLTANLPASQEENALYRKYFL